MRQSARDPRGALDPEVAALFELLRSTRPAQRALEPAALRAAAAAMVPSLNAGSPDDVAQRELRFPGPTGELRALCFAPQAPAPRPRPLLVYLHGGGWVIFGPESHARLAKLLCRGADAVLVSVDYRLAPEHPHPAPLDDAVAAFRWLRAHAAELGADPQRAALAGDSAGGQLTAAATLRLLAAGEPPPRAALLLCPVTDLRLDTASYRRFAPDDPILDAELMEFFRACHAPPALWDDPFVSPLCADLAGFPPTCVVAAGLDPLLDDALRFADRLRAAGREVGLLQYPGMPHIFPLFPGLRAGARALADCAGFLRRALG